MVGAALVFLAIALPNLWVLIAGEEAWPFTNAPMFAASPTRNELYEPRIVVETAQGTDHAFSSRTAAGISNWHFWRLFWGKVYGSIDPATPWDIAHDDPASFQRRMTDALRVLSRRAAVNDSLPGAARALRVELVRQGGHHEVHVVGRYLLSEDRFVAAQFP